MPTVWSTGWNMPGYMPDNPPNGYADRLTALRAMVDELAAIGNTDLEVAGEYELAAASLEGRDAEGGDWSWTSPDGYVYWIEAVDLTEDEAREALGEDA